MHTLVLSSAVALIWPLMRFLLYTSLQGGKCIHPFVYSLDVYGFLQHLFQCEDMQGVIYLELSMCIYPFVS